MNKTIRTPYQRLLDAVIRFRSRVLYPKKTQMWLYPTRRLNEGWALGELHERVAAANQLKHDVMLVADDQGLRVMYVQRPGEIDYPGL